MKETNEDKYLEDIGIVKIQEIDSQTKNKMVIKFAKMLVATFEHQNFNYGKITKCLLGTRMYIADFKKNLGSASYFYKNRCIYIDKDADLNELDEYIIHEFIHCVQDIRIDKDYNRIGLCTISEFKIHGLALNEAAVQYITSKMLNKSLEEINYRVVILKTRSKEYYPLLSNLIEQIVYLYGEDIIVESTINGSYNFQEQYIGICSEKDFNKMELNIDKILDIRNKLSQGVDYDKQIEKIVSQYLITQDIILNSYFNRTFSKLKSLQDVELYKSKLEGIKDFIGYDDEYKKFNIYKEEKLKLLRNKMLNIMKADSINMPKIISKNKIFELFKYIRSLFMKKEY